jgi:hypothetical protein
MRSQWTIAALLSSALIVACGDRGAENTNETPQAGQAPAAGAGAPDQVNPPAPGTPPAATVDGAATAPDSSGARATAGTRAGGTRPVPRTGARDGNTGGQTGQVAPSEAADPTPGVTTRAPQAPPRAQFREVTVPANTILPLELMTALSSATAQVETPVRARVRQAILIDGVTAIPAGTVLTGEVFEVERAGRVRGRSRLAIRFNEAEINGAAERLRTNPIIFEGEATRGEDATKIGVGAGIGAAIGGIVGGGEGAAKGAAIGGAAGTGAVLATRGREVELASGADLSATLASPVEIRVANR